MEHPVGGHQGESGKMIWLLSKDFLAWDMKSGIIHVLLKPRNLMSLFRCQVSSIRVLGNTDHLEDMKRRESREETDKEVK